ncbi:MAG: flavin reductase family protein [Epulopiscium sp.]|nr:flavin reductase family protein [Candidatus Epulonipiscium sp.]
MIKEVHYMEYAKEVVEQLPKGAFLTTKKGEEINTMTIGWGTLGPIWNRPIFTVAVRYSRHTYDMLEKGSEFTISLPLENNDEIKKALGVCGKQSGRDIDKFMTCGLTVIPGQKVNVPIIGECELHYECKIVYKQAMEPGVLDPSIKERFYQGSSNYHNNYHVIYYGEIVTSYLKSTKNSL